MVPERDSLAQRLGLGTRISGRDRSRRRSPAGRRQSDAALRGSGFPRSAARHLQIVVQFHLCRPGETGHAGAGVSATVTFNQVRKIALSLPNVEEGTSYGTPPFKTGGKLVARLKEDGDSLVVGTTFEERQEMLGADPETY